MGDFDWFQNADLRRALELRRDGKYKEGLEVLKMASRSGCGQACYFLGEAYDIGGWSLKPNGEAMDYYTIANEKPNVEAMKYYTMANENGCSWGLRRLHNLATSTKIMKQIKKEGRNHEDPITRAYFDDKIYEDSETIEKIVKVILPQQNVLSMS